MNLSNTALSPFYKIKAFRKCSFHMASMMGKCGKHIFMCGKTMSAY